MINKPERRRFPPPWSVEEPDPKLDRRCFTVRDANGQALAYVYFEGEMGRRSAAHLLTHDEARRNRRLTRGNLPALVLTVAARIFGLSTRKYLRTNPPSRPLSGPPQPRQTI
jgi:hypothetical protein